MCLLVYNCIHVLLAVLQDNHVVVILKLQALVTSLAFQSFCAPEACTQIVAVHNGAIITMMLWVSAMGPVGLVCVYFLLRLHFQKIKIIKKKKRNRGPTGFVRWKTEQFSTLKGSFLFFIFLPSSLNITCILRYRRKVTPLLTSCFSGEILEG